jgi:hypothetical protein
MDLQFLSEDSSEGTYSLIVSFRSPLKGKGGKKALEHTEEVEKTLKAREEKVNENATTNVLECILDIPNSLKAFMVQQNQTTMALGQVVVGLGLAVTTLS